MTDGQWQRAKAITADALEREASTRNAFLEDACADDAEVRHEVLRLLAEAESAGHGFLSNPPLVLRSLLVQRLPQTQCFELAQEVAGRFRIERFLGRGAMGEVYAALDLELQEAVALKTINPAIALSPNAIERFKREVKQSRRITNVCVCRIYDLFSHEQPHQEPVWFLTMKLLDGETLGASLAARGRLPMQDALSLIKDMVEALSAAHALGIVHRDFKPNNVMLVKDDTKGERAIVTDFGLALDISKNEAGPGVAGADGTPAYMAPEQASGGRVGFEADQFALGLVICEILTGSRPMLDRFSAGESRSQLEEWLKRQPRQNLNARARLVIRRCLEFQPEDRFRHIRDAIPVLEGTKRRVSLRWAGAAATLAAALSLALALGPPDAGLQVKDSVLVTPESGLSSAPRISRDGKWIVYSSNRGQPSNLDIWIQPVGAGPAKRLTTHPAEDNEPAVSPDGKLVAFRSERDGGGLYVIHSDGSEERLLVPGGRSPVFSPDGRWIAFWVGTRDDTAPSAQLYLISPEGGQPRRLAGDFADARYPTWNSNGKLLMFDGCRTNAKALPTCTDWWVIRPDGINARNTGALALLKSRKIELPTPPQKCWRGAEVYFSGARDTMVALWSLRLSPDSLRIGAPRRVTLGEGEREPSIAENGAIVFGRITAAIHIWQLPLTQGMGNAAQVTDNPAFDACPGVSRGGRWMYFTRKIRGIRQLLVRDLSTNGESVVFHSEENEFWPISSPGGERAVFEVRRDTESSIWLANRDGSQARSLCSGCSHPTSWFGDQGIFYTTAAGAIALLKVDNGASHLVLLPAPSMVLGGADWNPSNQYLLFTAGAQGHTKQVFGVRFPSTTETPLGPWIQLTHGLEEIDQPHWAAHGHNFYFLSNRDAFKCVWGRSFSAHDGVSGPPFPVMHYHDLRFSPDRASPGLRGLTVAENSIFLSVGEVTDTLWLGRLDQPPLLSLSRWLPRGRY